jgi:hypothetical protein
MENGDSSKLKSRINELRDKEYHRVLAGLRGYK